MGLSYVSSSCFRIGDASGRDVAALRNMTFEGATEEQTAQLKSLVSQRLNNDAGQRARGGISLSLYLLQAADTDR